MAGGFYRDAEAALRARIQELVEVARYRESLIAPELLRFLPPATAGRLETARSEVATAMSRAESHANAQAAAAALDTLAQVLDEVLAELEDVGRSLWDFPPTAPAPPELREASMFGMEMLTDRRPFADAITKLVRRVDERAVVEIHAETLECLATFRERDVPIAMRYRVDTGNALLYVQPTGARWLSPLSGDFGLSTSAPLGTNELVLAPQFARHTIGKAFGLVADVEIDDPDIDTAFLIRGDSDFARAVITADLRDKLVAFSRFDVPKLTFEPGRISMTWRYDTSFELFVLATGVLRAARNAVIATREATPNVRRRP